MTNKKKSKITRVIIKISKTNLYKINKKIMVSNLQLNKLWKIKMKKKQYDLKITKNKKNKYTRVNFLNLC